MTQVNHGESEMMRGEEVDIFAIITDQQGAELVDPGAFFRAAETGGSHFPSVKSGTVASRIFPGKACYNHDRTSAARQT